MTASLDYFSLDYFGVHFHFHVTIEIFCYNLYIV